MRANRMHLAAVVTILSLLAGCVSATPGQSPPTPLTPEVAPPAASPSATQSPPTLSPTTAPTAPPSAPPSAAAPAADLLALVKAFEEAYNRHDVDAALGLFGPTACVDWGAGPDCNLSNLDFRLRHDAALNSKIEMSACSADGDRVTCKAVQRDDCLAARGLDGTGYAAIVFTAQGDKIAAMTATKAPEDAQRDLLFLYSLAGWAHRTQPAEWDRAGRGDLLDIHVLPRFDEETGTVTARLCEAYAAVAVPTSPSPTPEPPQAPPSKGEPGNVLFISDTNVAGLDALLPRLVAAGLPSASVAVQLDYHPGAALGGHYELGDALEKIRQSKWDVVVLHDDLYMDWPAREAQFAEYGRKFDRAIRQAGADTVLLMPHPYPAGNEESATTEAIAAAYRQIGQELGAKVAPVGLAFRRSLRERPDLDLLGPVGYAGYASWAGIYLEGCVLYATLFGRSPVGLAYRMQGSALDDWQLGDMRAVLIQNGRYSEISEEDAAYLQRIAWETVQDYQAGR